MTRDRLVGVLALCSAALFLTSGALACHVAALLWRPLAWVIGAAIFAAVAGAVCYVVAVRGLDSDGTEPRRVEASKAGGVYAGFSDKTGRVIASSRDFSPPQGGSGAVTHKG